MLQALHNHAMTINASPKTRYTNKVVMCKNELELATFPTKSDYVIYFSFKEFGLLIITTSQHSI